MNTNTEKISVPRFLTMFKKFSPSQKVKIAERIDKETFAERWKLLDAKLPDVEISEDEIMNEVKSIRYGERSSR